MPAKPLSPQQERDAARLKAIFEKWREEHRGPTGRKPSQETMATKFPFGQSALSQYLNGAIPLNKEVAVKFASVLDCRVEDFSQELAFEISELSLPSDEKEFVEVKRADVAFSNGRGKLVFLEGRRSALSFRADYLRKLGVTPRNAVIVDAEGHSNDPDIKDGAVLLVDRGSKDITSNGKFYAFRKDGELMVKMLTRNPDGSILAVSKNPDRKAYPDMLFSDEDRDKAVDFELIGRVLWHASQL